MKEAKEPYDENGNKHGYWEVYWYEDKLSYKGYYIHGKKHGYFEEYHFNGYLISNGHFANNKLYGSWLNYGYKKCYFHIGIKIYVTNKNKFII